MIFIKIIIWIKLFLFSVFWALLICGIIVSSTGMEWNDPWIIIILAISVVLGICFATYQAMKHDLVDLDTELMQSKDVDEWVERNKNNHSEKTDDQKSKPPKE